MRPVSFSSFVNEVQAILQGGHFKLASELTEEARSHIAKKNFAVSGKKSNTGKPAYPIPDKQHAISALGFAKMHGDKADLAEVKKDVAKKFPGLEKGGSVMGSFAKNLGAESSLGKHLAEHGHHYDLAGLGVLAAPSVHTMVSEAKKPKEERSGKEMVHAGTELAGLGTLAAPVAYQLARGMH